MIEVQDFLKRVLSYYAGSFDVTAPCTLGGKEHAALASMHSHEDQYVRVVGTTLWEADSHEHSLFEVFPTEAPAAAEVQSLFKIVADVMEPQLVRGGEPLPPKNHQYTYLSLVLLSQKAPSEETIRAVQALRFTKFYHFYLRGYSEARVLLVDLENRALYTNRAGRGLKKLYALALKNAAKAETDPPANP